MNIRRFLKKKEIPARCSVVVVAAGSSSRMGKDKLMMELCGMPVLARTLNAFQQCTAVDEIVVVTRGDRLAEIADLCHNYGMSKVSQVVSGGASRMESALAGVSALSGKTGLIAIHDGARPLVTSELIESTVKAAAKHMAAVPVIKSTDTLKVVDENGFIVATVDRESTVRVQTPQIFDADLIKGALTKAAKDNLPITDDCSAIEMMGIKAMAVDGDVNNIKLTTPEDIRIAEMILQDRGEDDAYRARV